MISATRIMDVLLLGLVANIFLSKVSVFSMMMSTLINLSITMVIALFLLLFFHKKLLIRNGFRRYYIYLIFLMLALMAFQAIGRSPFFLQLAGYVSVLVLFILFGIAIPKLYPLDRFLAILAFYLKVVGIISSILLLVGWGAIYEGGRFLGVFNSSVVMSQVAIIGFIVFFVRCFEHSEIQDIVFCGIYFMLLVLSGSRSALLISTGIAIVYLCIAFRPASFKGLGFKYCLVFLLMMSGPMLVHIGVGIIQGKIGIGSREVITNPIEDRKLHWFYGYQKLLEKPVRGHGVLTKYEVAGKISLENFNEMNDPHNLFMYAGQVGGIPLMVLVMLFYIFLLVQCLTRVRGGDGDQKVIVMLVMSFLPMFFVGGSLISLGSLFDRLFWLFVGYLSLNRRV